MSAAQIAAAVLFLASFVLFVCAVFTERRKNREGS